MERKSSRLPVLVFAVLMCFLGHGVDASPLPKRSANTDNDEPLVAIDDLMQRASNSSGAFDFFYDPSNHLIRTELDIVVTEEEYAEMKSPHRHRRAAGVYPSQKEKRWPNNVINFEMQSVFSAADKREIYAATEEWSRYTCLKFQENNAWNRIYMIDDKGCYSLVGMSGGIQPLSLSNGCRFKRIVLHELGHAIGLHHEQTRPDRDDHVTVKLENIEGRMTHNFDKYDWEYIIRMGVPYDYFSIMHYSSKAFSKNGEHTVVTKDPEVQDIVGHVPDLSFRDIKTVSKMYDCHQAESYCGLKDEQCEGEGFVGKDCTCWCPGNPVKHCDPQDDDNKGLIGEECADLQPNTCPLYASAGRCRTYPTYMYTNCKKSCGAC